MSSSTVHYFRQILEPFLNVAISLPFYFTYENKNSARSLRDLALFSLSKISYHRHILPLNRTNKINSVKSKFFFLVYNKVLSIYSNHIQNNTTQNKHFYHKAVDTVFSVFFFF